MAKRTPLTDIQTIYFQYFEAGFNPNEPNKKFKKEFASSVIWCKIHGEWFKCPIQRNIRSQLTEIRVFLTNRDKDE